MDDPLRASCRQQQSTWPQIQYEPTVFTTEPGDPYPNGAMISNLCAGDTRLPRSIPSMRAPDCEVEAAISAALDILYQTVSPPEIDIHRTIAAWTVITAAETARYPQSRFTPFSHRCTHHALTRPEFDRLMAETQRRPETNAVQLAMELRIDDRPTIVTWSGIRQGQWDPREGTYVHTGTFASMTLEDPRRGSDWEQTSE